MAGKFGLRWTKDEDDALREMIRNRCNKKFISRQTGRSVMSVKRRMQKLKLHLPWIKRGGDLKVVLSDDTLDRCQALAWSTGRPMRYVLRLLIEKGLGE